MPDLISVRLVDGHRPAQKNRIELPGFDVGEKDRPIQFANGRRDTMLRELVLENQRYALARGVAGIHFDLETKGNFPAVDHLIQNTVTVAIAPAGLLQEFQALFRIVVVTPQALVVLGPKEINRPFHDLAPAK